MATPSSIHPSIKAYSCSSHCQKAAFMASNLQLVLFVILSIIGLLGSHADADADAAVPSQLYWKSILPNTPMPQSLTNMLQPADDKDKKVGVNVGVNVHNGKGGTDVDASPFIYNYAASQNQLHDNPNVALFFLEKDLHKGTNMKLHFTGGDSNEATFLPRHVAKSVPFSSNSLPQILDYFSVKPGSRQARVMKNTIRECEEAGIVGEDKYCATSLESMIDFVTSRLGRNVEAISTEVGKDATPEIQKYRITGRVKEMASSNDKSVVCHKQKYPYAVFYCHSTRSTKAYMVPMEGSDGTEANAVAVCHTDTSAWNPKHLAFQVLKIMPGTSPVCHFLPQDHIVWVPK